MDREEIIRRRLHLCMAHAFFSRGPWHWVRHWLRHLDPTRCPWTENCKEAAINRAAEVPSSSQPPGST
jgi:hypothetical protein